MRQAGIIAAGALYALQHHRERLVDDHVHAEMLADTIRNCKGLKLVPEQVDSNIVIFEVEKGRGSTAGFMAALEAKGVRALAMTSTRIRLVTHLDVDRPQIEKACQAIREITAGA